MLCELGLGHIHQAVFFTPHRFFKFSPYEIENVLKKKKNPKSKKTILETLLVLLFSWYYYFFNRHLLVIRHWHFDWWMQRCTQTWVCSHLLLQLLIAESSFIKWFASLLTRLEEMAIWTSWVSNLRSMSFIFLSTEGLAGK